MISILLERVLKYDFTEVVHIENSDKAMNKFTRLFSLQLMKEKVTRRGTRAHPTFNATDYLRATKLGRRSLESIEHGGSLELVEQGGFCVL